MKHMKWVAVALSVLMAVIALTACSNKDNGSNPAASAQPEQTLEAAKPVDTAAPEPDAAPEDEAAGEVMTRIKEAGKIILATSADYPPYEFIIEKDGGKEIVGMDILIAEEIAKDLGVELEVQDMDFEGTIPALQSNNADFVLAGMTPNEERAQVVDFSDTYFNAGQAVIIRAADKDTLTSVESLKDKKVGAQTGTVQMEMVEQQIQPADTLFLAKIPNLLQELKNGNIDALVLEKPVAIASASAHSDLWVSEIAIEDEVAATAVAVPKNNPDLLESINVTIKRLQDEGKIDEFAETAGEILITETIAE